MTSYIYVDNLEGRFDYSIHLKLWVAPVVFECRAHNVRQADHKFFEEKGYDPHLVNGLSIIRKPE